MFEIKASIKLRWDISANSHIDIEDTHDVIYTLVNPYSNNILAYILVDNLLSNGIPKTQIMLQMDGNVFDCDTMYMALEKIRQEFERKGLLV